MSEGRTKEEERDAYDPARVPTQLADTHASLSLLLSCVPRSLIGWSCAPLLFHLTRNSNYGDSEQPCFQLQVVCNDPIVIMIRFCIQKEKV
ncbi:hypothetical protein DdX_19527 [Ditylenchus destructor]|uniref:Uncharacterized protein n=1 Tax=Ditylenchus destructor TaxID=166010 RepID=A0AAD4QX72_9BILA|nr:hypothetical protein DdX_19527 [Ditylenchus destructor]